MVRKGNGARRSAVLLEEIHSEVRKIAEGHDTLARGINRLEERFGEFGQRLVTVEHVLGQHTVRLDHLDARMEQFDVRMDHLDVRMDHLDGRMKHLDARMEQFDVRMDHLDGRMEVLDGRMNQLVARFDAHEQAHTS